MTGVRGPDFAVMFNSIKTHTYREGERERERGGGGGGGRERLG